MSHIRYHLVRLFFIGMLTAVATVAGTSGAHAQAYPSRTIEFISHSSAGSGTDLFSRSISDLLAKEKNILTAVYQF